MGVLIFALIVCIVACLLVWAVSTVPMDARLSVALRVAIIIVAALVIVQRAGLV